MSSSRSVANRKDVSHLSGHDGVETDSDVNNDNAGPSRSTSLSSSLSSGSLVLSRKGKERAFEVQEQAGTHDTMSKTSTDGNRNGVLGTPNNDEEEDASDESEGEEEEP